MRGIGHPSVILHHTRLLESINDRLGGLEGENVPPMNAEWLDDLVDMGLPAEGIGLL